jgi:hypothetical protein
VPILWEKGGNFQKSTEISEEVLEFSLIAEIFLKALSFHEAQDFSGSADFF